MRHFVACLAFVSILVGVASATHYQLVLLPDTAYQYGSAYAQSYSGGGVVGYGFTSFYGSNADGLFWPNSSSQPIVLTPSTSLYGSYAFGGGSGQQVGVYYPGNSGHAILWFGSATNYVDLDPNWPHETFSEALGTNGTYQVGMVGLNTVQHATVWSGSAASAVDIHPAAYPNDLSSAYSIGSDNSICGLIEGTAADNYFVHACYWPSPSGTPVDLNPAGWFQTYGVGNDGTTQCGFGQQSGYNSEALIWHGTPDSLVDLGPGQAWATKNGIQVGDINNVPAIWHGVPGSGEYLPIPGYSQGLAFTIGDDGVIGGYVFAGYYSPSLPALWVPVPDDTIPPTISGLSVTPASVWPPDHKMHAVTVNYTVTDNMDPNPSYSISVSTNGAGKDPAFTVVDPHTVQLKAEPGLESRTLIYTVMVTATDASGNTSHQSIDVPVSL